MGRADGGFGALAHQTLRAWTLAWWLEWAVTAGLVLVEVAHGFTMTLFWPELVINTLDLGLLVLTRRQVLIWRGVVEGLEGQQSL